MSEPFTMEQAAGQSAQSAAVALQALVLIAQAVREHQRNQQAGNPTAPERVLDPETQRYALAVREKIQPPELADALINGPGWNRLADELRQLERSGIEVRQFLGDAAPLVARIDADLRAAITQPGLAVTPAALTPPNPFELPRQAQRPTVTDRARKVVANARERAQQRREDRVPNALGDRTQGLAREGIGPQQNARLVIAAREAIGDERILGQLVTSRQWPAIAGTMQRLQDSGRNPREALAGVPERIRQASAANIQLTAAEAANGLLSDQARSPQQSSTAPATSTSPLRRTPPVAAAPVPPAEPPVPTMPGAAPAASAAPVSPAPAVEPQHTVVYRWTITAPREDKIETVAIGETTVRAGFGSLDEVEKVAASELAARTNTALPADHPDRGRIVFSASPEGGASPEFFTLKASHPVVLAAGPVRPPTTEQGRERAAAARATSRPPFGDPGTAKSSTSRPRVEAEPQARQQQAPTPAAHQQSAQAAAKRPTR